MDTVSIAAEPADSPDALACVNAYFDELDARFPGGFDRATTGLIETAEVSPPYGGFLVVRAKGVARGCGAVRTLEQGVGEIKRMWLHSALRGRGAGRRLLAELEALSRGLGHEVVRLDTSRHLPEAFALYTASGYAAIPSYNDNPDADHWFEKRLDAVADG